MTPSPRLSVIVPAFQGERLLPRTLAALVASDLPRDTWELLVVDDGSTDGSLAILERRVEVDPIRVLRGSGRGSAAAINLGVRAARHPVICQVDQDVVVRPGWMAALLERLDDPEVAAVQGYYETDPEASVWARVMGYDLELRWARIDDHRVEHVCTGTTAYRRSALLEIGLFSETLGYGYDNDLAYRLQQAGYRLAMCRAARSLHHWRPSLGRYLAQQYGVGYGRLDLVARHPGRMTGDTTSGLAMILQVPLTLSALLAAAAALALAACGWPARPAWVIAILCLSLVVAERFLAGVRAWRRFGDPAGLAFVPVHLLRNLVWCWALVRWTARRLCGRSTRPSDSMGRCSEKVVP
jgi:GT2 family glycosyltransferase